MPNYSKILVVEDHPVYREGIVKIISKLDFVDVCHEAENGSKAIELIKNEKYDLVFLDLHLPDLEGKDIIHILKELQPYTAILILSMSDDKKNIVETLELGVNGYLLKNTDKDEILNALEIISEGRQYFSEDVYKVWADYLIDQKRSLLKLANQPYFGERELEVIRLFCEQNTAKAIAGKLNLSEATINNTRTHIMQKIGVDNIVGVVLYAVKEGIYVP